MSRILILHIEAGHGHKKAAEALAHELKTREGAAVRVEIFDALEKTNALFRYCYPRLYHRLVLWAPWLWGFFYYATNFHFLSPLIQLLRSFWNRLHGSQLRRYVQRKPFDT